MVQIAKEAISTKGPRLTCDISLAGRNIVLVPFSSKVFLSQKIRSNEEKKRLKRVAAGVLPKNFGVIIRTAATNATDLDVEQDILAAGGWTKVLRHSVGLVSTVAAASLLCDHEISREFIDRLWNSKNEPYEDGYFDAYYDGLLRLFAFMHLSGNYRVITPAE